MTKFYATLGRPGRCLLWGVFIMLILFCVGWLTNDPEMFEAGRGVLAMFIIGAVIAVMGE